MENPDQLTRWTARAAFALYAAALVWKLHAGQRPVGLKSARLAWTAACLLMLVHVGFAFDRVHHWSHDLAYRDTAKQPAGLFGLDWGGGLYANYFLLLIWLIDVVWWWRGIEAYESRSKSITWSIHGFLAFMWLHATVVFGHGGFRWIALAVFVLIAAMIWGQNKTASAGVQRKQSKGRG